MLVQFELSKIFRHRTLWIAFTAFLLINAFQLTQTTPYYTKDNPDYNYQMGRRLMYSKVEGAFSDEKIDFVLRGWDDTYPSIMSTQKEQQTLNDEYYTKTPYHDFSVYDEMKSEMQRQYEYNDSIKALKSYAEKNLAYISNEKTYEFRRNQLILDIYKERNIHSFYDRSGLENYLKYDFSSLLVLLLLLLGISPIFSSEKETGMAPLLSSSKSGRLKTVIAKVWAVIIFSSLFSMCFFAMDFVYYAMAAGFHGGQSALYTLIDFKYTPLTCTIWQYVILQGVAKWLGLVVVGFLFMLISSVFRETYPVFVLGTGLIVFFMITGEHFQLFNPISLLTFSQYAQELSMLNILSYPVLAIIVLPVSILVLALIILLLVIITNHKQWHISIAKLWHRKPRK